jgi:hypothetical protein
MSDAVNGRVCRSPGEAQPLYRQRSTKRLTAAAVGFMLTGMHEWTPVDVERETDQGYFHPREVPGADLARLSEWFLSRRGGPYVYAVWRTQHIVPIERVRGLLGATASIGRWHPH